MCGLIGFYSPHLLNASGRIGQNMASALAHRGPDDAGIWSDRILGLTLGHRRLSVLELSPAGSQPMLSADERYVIVFNGEVYNHTELRERLAGEGIRPVWRGNSDTETLLACFLAWGIEKTLQASVGMFAMALWDQQSRVLTLARDRMGEKPLYWGWQNDSLMFASELKGLKAHPSFKGVVNRNAVALFLRHGYISSPFSIYQGIHKLHPGHIVHIPLEDRAAAMDARSRAYWRFNDAVHQGVNNPFSGTPEQATDALEEQLAQSVRAQMIADVPLGAFLSGGIDSSLIVALMQANSSRPVQTFTMGFEDQRYNEAEHAKNIARHLGTEHTEFYVRPDDALAVIPRLSDVYDEPFADSSQIPTFMVSQLARQHVTVALSGDAGDELFGGYDTYRFVPKIWDRINRIPDPLRRLGATVGSGLSTRTWDALLAPARALSGNRGAPSLRGEKVHKLAELLQAADRHTFYRQLSSHWKHPEDIVIGATEPPMLLDTPQAWPDVDDYQLWMMAMSAQTYMIDDILVKVDRAAMANSLEVRVPMLDHRVVELAWRMPLHLKINHGAGKWLLRQVLHRHVPPELVERPKMGFSVPLAQWLRGPLRDWAEELLDPARLEYENYFRVAPIRQAWAQHLNGERDYSSKLWCVLMFQAWREKETTR